MITKKIEVYGKVQSVGFRPYVYNTAKKFNLKGYVRNKTSCVEIVVEGEQKYIENFLEELKKVPLPAKIEKIFVEDYKNNFQDFYILESEDTTASFLYIPAEIKTCNECLKELFLPTNRRYLYPFINCTHCGPRFTIIKTLPYDRENTTMVSFKMCDECYSEYVNPNNRRFHAQPNACYKCGPGLEVKKLEGEKVKKIFDLSKSARDVKEILDFVVKEILNGKIFAIKSYGGYHLVCDATNDDVVLKLRRSKFREYKPFAMMAKDLNTIKKYCYVSDYEEEILNSPEAPIVLLLKKEKNCISKYVAENSLYFGFMLPYTPLHFLIFYFLDKDIPLIMTSGNISDEPQVYKDEDVFTRLSNIADFFLVYNREINIRCDDSVVRSFNGNIFFIRRSRGYAPEPIFVNYKFKKTILSLGADLKNTFCLAKDNFLILSHHIGDLDNLEAINSYKESIDYYLKTFKFLPEVVVCDLHPLYVSSKIAKEFAEKNNVEIIEVQHHRAHMLSCMLDNGIFDNCIGVIFDGTGYGLDGKIWGSEFLVGDLNSFTRKAHFDYIKLIGGDNGIKRPYITAFGFLYEEYKDKYLLKKFYERIKDIDNIVDFDVLFEAIKLSIEEKFNLTDVCGVGRIFDLAGVFCGVGLYNYYEGQIPAVCEFYAEKLFETVKEKNSFYEYEIEKQNNYYLINTRKFLKNVFEDIFFNNVKKEEVLAKFHYTIVKMSLDILLKIRKELSINKVVISGGVFQNKILLESFFDLLKNEGFEVFVHKSFPTNDGGISAGQVLAV